MLFGQLDGVLKVHEPRQALFGSPLIGMCIHLRLPQTLLLFMGLGKQHFQFEASQLCMKGLFLLESGVNEIPEILWTLRPWQISEHSQ